MFVLSFSLSPPQLILDKSLMNRDLKIESLEFLENYINGNMKSKL